MEGIINNYSRDRKEARKAKVITYITSAVGFALVLYVFTGAVHNLN